MAARNVAALLAGWLLWGGALAADGLLQGELGRWLDQEVAPPLAETLSRHPRFQGETVRLAVITPGATPGTSNRLAQAVEAHLRQRLLAVDGVRLAVEQPRRNCEPPPEVSYLVRVEISSSDIRHARVHVAVVDVAESVWVSGISHEWQGRLSAAARTALATAVIDDAPGNPGSPIPIDRARAVAQAVKADLACLLPRDLDGSVYLATADGDALSRVGLALQSELQYEALASLTSDRRQARWVLTLDTRSAGPDVRELNAVLAAADGGSTQQVGSVFVSGMPESVQPVPADATAGVAPPPAPAAARSLLSALTLTEARREGICDSRKARVRSCVEVAFELREAAYLFVLSTREHVLAEVPCDGLSSRAEPGPRRFRVRVAPGDYAVNPEDTGPDAGFYVLAVREQSVATRLQAALAAAPGQCGTRAGAADRWLDDLARVLAAHGDAVVWQALHLVHDSSGIVAL